MIVKLYTCLNAFLDQGLREFTTHCSDSGQTVQGKSLGTDVKEKA